MRKYNFKKEPNYRAYVTYLLFVASIALVIFFIMGCVANSKPTYKLYEICERVNDKELYMYDFIPNTLKRMQVDINGVKKSCSKEGLIEVRNLEETE